MTDHPPSSLLWFDMWMESCATGLRLAETMAAASTVVNARMPMIGAAVCNPVTADWPELYKMVVEKAEAFMQASLSITSDMQAIHIEMLEPTRSATSTIEASARIQHHAIGAAGRALAPVHMTTTANASRLKAQR